MCDLPSSTRNLKLDRGCESNEKIVHGLQRETNQGPHQDKIPANQSVQTSAGCFRIIPWHLAGDFQNQPSTDIFDRPKADQVNQGAGEKKLRAQRIVQRLVQKRDQPVQRKRPQRCFADEQPILDASRNFSRDRRPNDFRTPAERAVDEEAYEHDEVTRRAIVVRPEIQLYPDRPANVPDQSKSPRLQRDVAFRD